MKIALYLLTQKGYEVLHAIIDNNFSHLIEQVIVGKDANVAKDYSTEIIQLCTKNKIKYTNRADAITVKAPYSIAISWRWIIKNPNSKLIVLHDSLLPKYRGFAPLVNALINTEPQVGVTALFASDYYDEGEIISQAALEVNYPVKIKTVISQVSKLYINLALDLFQKIDANLPISSIKQNESKATYSLWRNEADYNINWNNNAGDILNFINAVSSPYKGAATYINGQIKIRITEASIEQDVKIINRDAGKIIFIRNNLPVVVCGKGLLKITKAINNETGKSALPFKNFRTILLPAEK